jgi:hypothetical protein
MPACHSNNNLMHTEEDTVKSLQKKACQFLVSSNFLPFNLMLSNITLSLLLGIGYYENRGSTENIDQQALICYLIFIKSDL